MVNVQGDAKGLETMIQVMGDTLFFEDYQGWDKCSRKMAENPTKFAWAKMNTVSKHMGFAVHCLECGKGVMIKKNKTSNKLEKDKIRASWLAFWGCAFTQPGDSKPRTR